MWSKITGGIDMADIEDKMKTGTTTLGLVIADGVLLASEHRATMGTLIAHKNTLTQQNNRL